MSGSSDLRLQVILQAIDKATGPFKRVTDSSSKTARALRDARDKLKELNTQQKAVGEFRELRNGLKDTTSKLSDAQARVRQLAQTIGQVGPPTKAMARDFVAAKREAAALSEQHQRQSERVQALRDKLTAAGISASSLGAHERRLRTDIEATTRSVVEQTEKLKAQGAQQRRLAEMRARHTKAMLHTGIAAGTGLAIQAVGSRAVRGVLAPSSAFSAHEDSMLGVARQVPGARNELGKLTPVYRAIEEQVRELSGQIPIATTNISEMVTAAARMEVPTAELKEFTRLAAMMATAFDAVPDEITESMGKVAKNFKIPITQIEGLADAINYLDDNAISKGADIISVLNRTSGVVSTTGMSARDAAALGSTLLTLGERAETAGTATNSIVQKLAAATKGTKKL
jgi:phage-related tail protein